MALSLLAQVVADSPRKEQNHHHGRRNPERPIEIGVAFQDIQEIGPREDGGAASTKNLGGVDIEELRVERERPEKLLVRRGAGRGGRW